ncbi:unnamed protein product [Kluyveromyces dobzhanskii CBS 2104]|uniref:WGS project CCBQ000000000 data, contig 00012 n=1 Tax=Kluyveromyces dobzhanskii CBS 2104 TaxID=1427455 RepID=A0A0A8L369_9SACH|nr:unnamed protein product [Kluyveromyces dobzhanskii CBS 2104]
MSWSQGNASDVFSLGYDFANSASYQGLLLDTGIEPNLEAETANELNAPASVSDFSLSLADAYTLNYNFGETPGTSDGSINNKNAIGNGSGAYADADADADANADVDGGSLSSLPRQRRYSKNNRQTPPSSCSGSPNANESSSSRSNSVSVGRNCKRVSDSRLSARGLAEVLNLSSPAEALYREKFILDIFEKELQYPLGYKTWVRGTTKEYRSRILYQLHQRVKTRYPEYDEKVLETIIRRATYYMMQSRLRRERRARAKENKGKHTQNSAKERSASLNDQEFDMDNFQFSSNGNSVLNAGSNSDSTSNSFVTGNAFLM